ncbi:Ribosomal RNA-processing protein 7 [Terramyces sp. JEL0728]|nr:Ribosomal RNA-processing protein 7 [Terramyces sp. JEL0728]
MSFHTIKLETAYSPITNGDLQTHFTQKQPSKKVYHELFVRLNSSKQDFPENTLFMVNIPVDASEAHLKELFNDYGEILQVKLPVIMKSGSNCHVVFKDKESIDMILEIETLQWPDIPSTKYIIEKPDVTALKEKVDEAMLLFEDLERIEKQRKLDSRNVTDEDGFVLVTRQGRKNNIDGKGGSQATITKQEAEKLKPKNHALQDFYRFQMRERKRNELAELRRKFELDKEKIEKMKQEARFKPY